MLIELDELLELELLSSLWLELLVLIELDELLELELLELVLIELELELLELVLIELDELLLCELLEDDDVDKLDSLLVLIELLDDS